jgi:hypothetical protein
MGRNRTANFELPMRVYKRRKTYFYVCPETAKWKRLGTTVREVNAGVASLGLTRAVMPMDHLKVIYTTCRRNAATRGLEFSLTKDDLQAMWERSKGRCEVTGIKLDIVRIPDCKRRPLAPSIDRIDSRSGYTLENCRLVCVAVNLAINEWGEDLFGRVAKAYVRRREA